MTNSPLNTDQPPRPRNAGWYASALLYLFFIKPVSLLPPFLLYRVADFFFILLWHVFPYRKKVVLQNLERCFPEWDQTRRTGVAKNFYRHFSDLVVESLRNFSISRRNALARMVQVNPEVPDAFALKGQSIMLCGGHYGNWELWALAAPLQVRHQLIGIYKPLSNAFFDERMRKSRSRFGLQLVATRQTGNYLRTHSEEINALVFAFDQSPSNPQKCIWVSFLGQDTAAYFGAEKYALEFRRPVVYGHVEKVRRGHYQVTYEVVAEDPSSLPEGELTRRLFAILEADIRKKPEWWLWSHRRWKHRRPA